MVLHFGHRYIKWHINSYDFFSLFKVSSFFLAVFSKGSGSGRSRSLSRSNSSFSYRSDGRLSRQRSRDFIDTLCPENEVPPPAAEELPESRQVLPSEFRSLRDAVCDGPPPPELPKEPIKFLRKVDELTERLCPKDAVPPLQPYALTEDAG